MIDPISETVRLQNIVCHDGERKYYRFRGGQFYGGIASADCIGCMLDCVYCWSQKPRKHPEGTGHSYSARQVAEKLVKIAYHQHYNKVRITGNEPTLCKEHLLEVIQNIPNNLLFILETNGLLIDAEYALALSKFSNIHVRVSLKGATSNLFSRITGAPPEFFDSQLHSLKVLVDKNISCNAAIMYNFLDQNMIVTLRRALFNIHPSLVSNLEFETLIQYPWISKALTERGIQAFINSSL